ncbi:MAG: hypothetical protein M3015_00485 [Bacteroidota bacterium]|nr:hypothetical protein [Bacteroidota bacterium]
MKFADATIEENTNDDAEIIIPRKGVESISLKLEFYPDKTSFFKISPQENYFEFTMKPSLMEAFFENFQMTIDKKALVGKHPLLHDNEYTLRRRSNCK